MVLRQQLIQDRVDSVAAALGLAPDRAFLRLAHSIITGQSLHAFEAMDLVDGGQDKQIDTMTIFQDDDEAVVYLLSAKNTDSFSSNAIIQMRNGLDWVFNKPKADVQTLTNTKFKDRINELRAVLGGLGYSNVIINAAFVCNGIASDISDEFRQEAKHILDQYDNGTFGAFTFQAWGADELIARINFIEKKKKKIDAEVKIRYDANNPSLIKYHAEGLKGLVCSTSAREIARIVLEDASGAVFDSNIRRFLGTRGAVNTDILRTCTDAAISHQFWFLNNGLTVICDSFDPVTDPDNAHVKIKNMQIVNGCQTASALAIAESEKKLSPDARVMLRVYETTDSQLVDKIVLTTNNQNKISSRDLRSNDKVQVDMEEAFKKYDLYYERKINQYPATIAASKIIVNEQVAQAYLAIVLKKPSDARRRKYKVWGELYDKIFAGDAVEPYVISVLLARAVSSWIKQAGLDSDADDLTRKIANNGDFHVARLATYIWRRSDKWSISTDNLQDQIQKLDSNATEVQNAINEGFVKLREVLQSTPHYLADLDTAFKSATLDADLDKALYSQSNTKNTPATTI